MASVEEIKIEPEYVIRLSEDEASKLLGLLGDMATVAGIDSLSDVYHALRAFKVPDRYTIARNGGVLDNPYLKRRA